MTRQRSLVVAAILALAAGLAVVLPATFSAEGGRKFRVGVTHTQYSADRWGRPGAVRRAKRILRTVGPLQAQHIMGWGALNPEPRNNRYRWSSLDGRMRLIRNTGGTPVITLCCAPDWMKGGKPGQTNWRRLEVAPRPRHYDEFADLAVAVAKRYPRVRTFMVWNEFKGFYNSAKNRWNYEGYTRMYNAVYRALKRYDRTLRVGGPYMPMDSWKHPVRNGAESSRVKGRWGTIDGRTLDALRYWLRHKRGADFLVVDGSIQTNDGFAPRWRVGVRKFAAVDRWLRARSDLPIWWAEFYVGLQRGKDRSSPQAVRGALRAMRDSGARVAMLWGPECTGGGFPCIWTSSKKRGGGRPTGYTDVVRDFARR